MEDQIDKIEKYLLGDLSSKEIEAFESEIEKNPSLKEKTERYRQLLRGLEIGFNRELKSTLQKEEIIDIPAGAKLRRIYYSIGIAASIVLVISMIFVLRDNSLNSTELFASYYQPYANIESPVSRSESNKKNPYTYYENGDYLQAIPLFEKLIEDNPSKPAPVFYTGICNLEIDRPERSISYFEMIESYESSKYSRPALWYLGLSYLKLKEMQKAIDVFGQLSEGSDVYARNSIEILEKLR